MNRNSPQFKKLQQKWYDKLAKSGFEDIEKDEVFLYKYSTLDNVKNLYEYNEEYFRLAGQFLHEYKFKDTHEKMIWKFHSEGINYSEVPEKAKKALNMSRRNYFKILKNLVQKMKNMYGL